MARKVGRPSSYTSERGDAVCAALASGLSLSQVCKQEGMPDPATVYRWIQAQPEFRDKYAQAREIQAEVLIGEIIEIADDTTRDVDFDDEGNARQNSEYINRSRLRVDARKWYASKVLPKKYGDRLEVAGDPAAPLIPPKILIEFVAPPKIEE